MPADAHIVALEPMADANVGVARDFSNPSSTLLVIFGGLSRQPPVPLFEFLHMTVQLPVKRLFLRDVRHAWYHLGIPGFGDRLRDMAQSLRAYIDGHDIDRLVLVGGSAGAYAALALGPLLAADQVVAFYPQTSLDRQWLAHIRDPRWDPELDVLQQIGGLDPDFIDLRSWLERDHPAMPACQVHYAADSHEDEQHAKRLQGVAGVELKVHPEGGHALLVYLRKKGQLDQILRQALLV